MHQNNRVAFAVSKMPEIDFIVSKIKQDARELSLKNNLDATEMAKQLSEPHFDNNPMDGSYKNGEGDWPVVSVHGGNTFRRMGSDGIIYVLTALDRMKSIAAQENPARLRPTETDSIRAALGSFRYTYKVLKIDASKKLMLVQFKVYNKVSSESLTGGIKTSKHSEILHQFFVWDKTIDFSYNGKNE